MKYFIKAFVIIGLITFSLQSQAQVKFGVKAGINLCDIAVKYADRDREPDTKLKFGFHVGGTVDIGLMDMLSLQTGLLFSVKGTKTDLDNNLQPNTSVTGFDRYTYYYLQIPIHAALKIKNFQIYAGPYIAMGIGGKNKYDFTITYQGYEDINEGTTKYRAKLGKVDPDDIAGDEGAFKATDLGLDLGIGYQFGPILINTGFSFGLGNITPKWRGSTIDPKDWKQSNRVFT